LDARVREGFVTRRRGGGPQPRPAGGDRRVGRQPPI